MKKIIVCCKNFFLISFIISVNTKTFVNIKLIIIRNKKRLYPLLFMNEITNIILNTLEKAQDLIKYVKDRPGHDRRYSVDISKIQKLGWNPKYDFTEGIKDTIDWYVSNEEWWRKIKEGWETCTSLSPQLHRKAHDQHHNQQ